MLARCLLLNLLQFLFFFLQYCFGSVITVFFTVLKKLLQQKMFHFTILLLPCFHDNWSIVEILSESSIFPGKVEKLLIFSFLFLIML